MDGERAGDGGIFGVEGHVEPCVLAEVIEHGGKVFGLSGDEAVAHAGREHEIGKCGNHFLAADSNCHTLALGKADVVAPFLVEICEELVFGFAFDIQTEDVAGLDGLEVFAAFLGLETEALEHGREGGVGGRNIGVDFDDVGFVRFRQGFRAVKKLREGLAVVEVAHRAAAAVH